MSAWALQESGAQVMLFEAKELMSQTSAASTKMLHGGLRYLANGQVGLVKESLQERRWWMVHRTSLARPTPILLPCRKQLWSEVIKLGLGVKVYDFLARHSGFSKSRWMGKAEMEKQFPKLRCEDLCGGWLYWDGQMNDAALGLWAAEQAVKAGVQIREHTEVGQIASDGTVQVNGRTEHYDMVVNAAGPWAEQLLKQSGILPKGGLMLVRGSHLIIDRHLEVGLALPQTRNRLVFCLSFEGKTLLGTTEVEQSIDEPIAVSPAERAELLECYNKWFTDPISQDQILREFAGLRPLIRQPGASLSRASRESCLEINDRLITIWGGKWTTARLQGLAAKNACIEVLQKITRT